MADQLDIRKAKLELDAALAAERSGLVAERTALIHQATAELELKRAQVQATAAAIPLVTTIVGALATASTLAGFLLVRGVLPF